MLFFDTIVPKTPADTRDFPLVNEGIERLLESRVRGTAESR
ncbi:hypothetical protein SJ05684_c30380 [Sinorhizobium sojae CCBAU 05684]|uniref:Uncharacterized protein n=1 Tax=Sinorhizobium sojae CCBAU 05684 TaxID=716928 RepID=A0A249PFD4_9HYPH|nr:hypothetical protein SJ05684_c30380 [Sinorhizobium sojae CCBAU 05684]